MISRTRVRFVCTGLCLWAYFATFPIGSPAAEPQAENPAAAEQRKAEAVEKDVTQGALRIVKDDGTVVECPLKHTDVQASIAGFVARVKVKQTFHNPTDEKIEAVYVFPLPHEAAVDDMTMVIGDRRIVGVIKRRDEARRIYEEALAAGMTTALLEQERPNIFTQSVGNIEPGQEINIEISYVDVLRYDVGTYEFQFPMVVGPRYIPGAPISSPQPTPPELSGQVSPPVADTTRVPDASRISPPVMKPDVRNGHDISLSVKLDAGVPVQGLTIPNHQSNVARDGERRATIKLSAADSIPNKDFVLRYDVVGDKPEMAILAHTGSYTDTRRLGDGYFMLMIQPQEDERLTKSPPREIVFLVDVSGSMSGQPTAKVIDTMQNMLKLCREKDTVQVITFASQANKLFEKPVPVNDASIQQALNFTAGLRGSGGTEMLKGVKLAIDEPIDAERLRIVVMLTDGYIGNEAEIIEHVGKHCGDQIRFWCVGIGSSPNMFLVDGVAKQGGGMGKQLGLEDDASAMSQEIMTRIQRAQLAKIKIDWGDLQVGETFPARIPELWAGRPVILFGRYTGGGNTNITISGNVEGEAVSWPLAVSLPAKQPDHDALAKIWARRKIEDLMQQTYYQGSPAVEEEVTAIALDYRLMSQYTSFVAVDEEDIDKRPAVAKPPRRMLVPVPLPEGTRWEGFFGPEDDLKELKDGVPLVRLQEFAGRNAAPGLGLQPQSSSPRPSAAFSPANRPSPVAEQVRATRESGRVVTRFAMPALQQAAQNPAAAKSLSSQVGTPLFKGRVLSGSGAMGGMGGIGGGGFGARGGAVTSYRRLSLDALERFEEAEQLVQRESRVSYDFTLSALAAGGDSLGKAAQASLDAGQAARDAKKFEEAQAALQRAYLQDFAAANSGHSDGTIAADALTMLEEIRHERHSEWAKQAPALEKQLELALRDMSLIEAVRAVAQAAGMSVNVIDGSEDDAATIVSPENLRVVYLDLRGATVAEALDWILLPARMTWRFSDGQVTAGTQRRMEGSSTWVYDATAIALPDAESLTKLDDHAKATAEAQRQADAFLSVVRAAIGKAAGSEAEWYAPGQILVVGDTEAHAKIAKLLADLSDPSAKLAGEAAELHKATSQRAKDRRDEIAKRAAAERRASVAREHDAFGWQLLAASALAQLDDEAFTRLQVAWKDSATAELLQGENSGVVLRSYWLLSEAARSIGGNQAELQALLRTAKDAVDKSAAESLEALKKDPNDAAAYARVLYAALAKRDDDAQFLREAVPLLTGKQGEQTAMSDVAALAQALLIAPRDVDTNALRDVVERGVYGEDLVVLAALACQRMGGETWSTFRAEARHLLGDQPLEGNVVVFVNRLHAPSLATARRN